MGIYLFPKKEIKLLHNYIEQGKNPDKMGYFMEWLIQNQELHAHVYKEKWFDIGWHGALEQARKGYKG